MKCLLLFLFPVFAFGQPKKAVIFSKKSGQTISDSVVVWKDEEAITAKLYIGEKTITIDNDQYSIDSVQAITETGQPIYTYFISLRGKKARCYLYPADKEKEWGLLLDTNTSMILYRLRE